MSEVANNQAIAPDDIEKPVQVDNVKFPPFPEPTDEEFEDDVLDEERNYYKEKFPDISVIKSMKLHCTACDRHLGSSTRNESRMRSHPMLRTLVCHTCHTFYNSGEFEKGDDGSELYCRWCGQGGQVYCCSDCPHVFCAKCVKRNFGMPKIKEIENTDDWKCFKCNPRCLWDLRALCWALLRYCDLKNKITYKTEDLKLKEAYQKDCAIDFTDCCKNKVRRKEKTDPRGSAKKETDSKKNVNTSITRAAPTIQVKKFASININELQQEKKPQKRPASPIKPKSYIMKNPMATINPMAQKMITPVTIPPSKKIRMPVLTTPIRINQDKRPISYQPNFTRIRPKPPTMIIPSQFNGYPNNNTFNNASYNNMVINDNINLSLESLTQGLDMAAVVAMSNNTRTPDDDVVCTPDFPLEPLCEVTEDNDDDVECITPAPATKPATNSISSTNSTSIISRMTNTLPDISPDNIIQMTDDDVTVNTVTGGLKFRVDPQTLSSNKMYRLPDGRIFAINANPSMPGGYSATIVAVTETAGKQIAPKGATYAAKLSAVTTPQTSTPKVTSIANNKRNAPKASILRKNLNAKKISSPSTRDCDMQVSVEWYRFNLLEAIDTLEYSLGRLEKLRKQATTMYLRQRSVDEMQNLHKTLERVLNTSSTRFNEVRDNLNKEFKQYIMKKTGDNVSDDDDVEILPDTNDDPIFIDENSVDSTNECVENQHVDLTGVGSSDHNDSLDVKDDNDSGNAKDSTPLEEGPNDDNISNSSKNEVLQEKPANTKVLDSNGENKDEEEEKDVISEDKENAVQTNGPENSDDNPTNDITIEENSDTAETDVNNDENVKEETDTSVQMEQQDSNNDSAKEIKMDTDSNVDLANDKSNEEEQSEKIDDSDKESGNKTQDSEMSAGMIENRLEGEDKLQTQDSEMSAGMIENMLKGEDKSQDPEISEEMIENLLKDDTVDEIDNILNNKVMDVK